MQQRTTSGSTACAAKTGHLRPIDRRARLLRAQSMGDDLAGHRINRPAEEIGGVLLHPLRGRLIGEHRRALVGEYAHGRKRLVTCLDYVVRLEPGQLADDVDRSWKTPEQLVHVL